MSEEVNVDELKQQIANLTQELEAAKQDNSFDELKQKYEKIIDEKNKEITELNKTVDLTNKKVDEAVGNLNSEVQEKLKANEEYKKLLADVEELQKDKAEATVDSFIHKGVILPAQRETAIKLCLNDNDTFLDLYRDAKPIVDTTPQRRSVPTGTAERIANYFKN